MLEYSAHPPITAPSMLAPIASPAAGARVKERGKTALRNAKGFAKVMREISQLALSARAACGRDVSDMDAGDSLMPLNILLVP